MQQLTVHYTTKLLSECMPTNPKLQHEPKARLFLKGVVMKLLKYQFLKSFRKIAL